MNPSQDTLQQAETILVTAPAATQPGAEQATPASGGCYTRDPLTGEITLATPSTQQE